MTDTVATTKLAIGLLIINRDFHSKNLPEMAVLMTARQIGAMTLGGFYQFTGMNSSALGNLAKSSID